MVGCKYGFNIYHFLLLHFLLLLLFLHFHRYRRGDWGSGWSRWRIGYR
jgi:hypothetical protein